MTATERLARYRAEKSEEYNKTRFTENKFIKSSEQKRQHIWNTLLERVVEAVSRSGIAKGIKHKLPSMPLLGWTLFLKSLLWLILFGLFVELEFGMVFVILSTFYLIYANTRTGTRLRGEPSAYSVFNPNCERLQGSLTAEQFEGELRYGSGSVR